MPYFMLLRDDWNLLLLWRQLFEFTARSGTCLIFMISLTMWLWPT